MIILYLLSMALFGLLVSISIKNLAQANLSWVQTQRKEGKEHRSNPFAAKKKPVILDPVDLQAEAELNESLGLKPQPEWFDNEI